MSRVAICYCGEPLISTFMFSGAEYFCVRCGASLGMFDTESKEMTPELRKRAEANEKKWHSISKGLLTGGVMFRNCDTCSKENTPHLNHATQEELQAHKKALKKLERIGE